ncbi:MAG TPA: hypothetical protein VHZ26_06460 [Caulobacteraceae bacterium]|nr:hypothetical protein [Caulobacteraceae bacterium]
MRRTAALTTAILVALTGGPAFAAPWPDTPLGRTQALAVIETLNAELLASSSATATLEAWCGEHHMASPARLTAELVRGVDKPVTVAQRRELQVSADDVVKYRRVRLACGGRVLSEADNWYVPSRLTPEMNRVLETSDTPFGRAVAGLHPVRQTLSAELLWSPLPTGWELGVGGAAAPGPAAKGAALAIPEALFRHRALLYDQARRPFSDVVETYTGEVLHYPR